MLIRHLVT